MESVLDTVLLVEVFVTLFVIMDPVGTVPIFLSLTGGRSPAAARRAAWQAVAVSFFVISLFAFFGQQILSYLHISLPALQGAGGLLLLLVALELLTGNEQEPTAAAGTNVALVPLGTPLLAGPGRHRRGDAVRRGHRRRGRRSSRSRSGVVLVHVSLWVAMRYSLPILRVIRESRRPAGHPHRRSAALGDRRAARRRLGAGVHRRRGVTVSGCPARRGCRPAPRRTPCRPARA